MERSSSRDVNLQNGDDTDAVFESAAELFALLSTSVRLKIIDGQARLPAAERLRRLAAR